MATEEERSRRWPLSRRRRPSTISSSVHLLWWTVDQTRIFHDKPIAVGMLSELGFNGPALSEDLIIEICRCGGAELYTFAVGSREVIWILLHVLGTDTFDLCPHLLLLAAMPDDRV
ncbi:hypothetical protein C4D60_Mb04t39940 [Musa balbisiana]|uniref:Uncharacterized protein n=1 Tax=Musa balbisiana TaxID=52838 RepID=A0A4S8KIB9_MUSBA|nr:hypothetical protein C4D60_Mb04t39940 [Musa balbisiana]